MSVEPGEPGGAVQRARSAGVDFGVVVYGLLIEVLSNVGKSHGVESEFAREVKRKVDEVRTDMTRADESAVRRMEKQSVIEEQWRRLRTVLEGLDT